jgi:glycerol transport system ATP-binding protein
VARIELIKVAHRYGSRSGPAPSYALAPLDLVWSDGGAYALLGPSGCGKSTLLNIISGLLRPSEGTVLIDGRDVTRAAPEVRNIAQVFQFPVVYDTMTVSENLAFPLRNRGATRQQAKQRVEQIAALLELTPDLHKRASGLSADMKQRISLGRGLVRKDVAAILLDEPLTVIDPHVKWLLRRKLLQIHQELRVTLIYVTHDQTEALTLADEIVVMNEGRVLQRGSPQALFEAPAHTFVGYFIGSPGMNLLPCTIDDSAAIVDSQRIPLAPSAIARARARGGDLTLGVRPEFLRLSRSSHHELSALPVVVSELENLGASQTAFVLLGKHRLAIKLPESEAVEPGMRCFVHFPPAHTLLYADGVHVV